MIKNIVKYRFVSLISLASLALVVGGFFWAYGALRGIGPEPLILHFNDMDGITTVGSFTNLIYMAILGVCMVVINFYVAIELELRDSVMGKIVACATFVMAILLFIGFAAILNVN